MHMNEVLVWHYRRDCISDFLIFYLLSNGGGGINKPYYTPSANQMTDWHDIICCEVQRQTAVTAYLKSKQLLPFGFARQLMRAYMRVISVTSVQKLTVDQWRIYARKRSDDQ